MHEHPVFDTDARFKINTITRAITNGSQGKTVLIQGDHNSERFTFEVDRNADGHDLSLCNVAQIHYINISSADKSQQSIDVYDVLDLGLSEDKKKVTLSWLISGNATKYAGSLNFLVKFKCLDESGKVVYVWNTSVFSGISVSNGMDNGETIVTNYSDILEWWRENLRDGGYYHIALTQPDESTMRFEFTPSREDMAEVEPVNITLKPGKDGVGVTSVEQTTTSTLDDGYNIVTVTLSNGEKKAFRVKNGSKGSQGEKGDPGESPELPVFDLSGDGGFALAIPIGMGTIRMDTTEIRAALNKGPVAFILPFRVDGKTMPARLVMNSASTGDVYQCVTIVNYTEPCIVQIVVEADTVSLSCMPMVEYAGVPEYIDEYIGNALGGDF